MKIDVSSLNDTFDRKIQFIEEVNLFGDGNVTVNCDGNIHNLAGKYTFKANIILTKEFKCDCCLDSFVKDIKFEMIEVFSKNIIDDEIWSFSSNDNIIDLKEALRANTCMNLPMKVLCSNNCKGLCSKCGQNLNEGDCSCNKEYINPQFEEILHLFKNKEV